MSSCSANVAYFLLLFSSECQTQPENLLLLKVSCSKMWHRIRSKQTDLSLLTSNLKMLLLTLLRVSRDFVIPTLKINKYPNVDLKKEDNKYLYSFGWKLTGSFLCLSCVRACDPVPSGNDSSVDGLVNFEKLRMIAKEIRHVVRMTSANMDPALMFRQRLVTDTKAPIIFRHFWFYEVPSLFIYFF